MERELLDDYVRALKVKLRIQDWFIELTPKPELDTCFVACQAQDRRAEVFYNPDDSLLKYHIAHELVHVMLYDMSYLACDGQDIGTMKAYTYLEERVCDVVAGQIYSF